MAETLTPHYSWIKPDIGGDASTWGNVLNQTIDAVDSVVWANQQAGLPIGSVSMFAGAAAPPNWLICDGTSLPTSGGTYDGLFAAIGYAYGGSGANFNLPNLSSKFPLGANPSNPVGQAAGSYTYTIDVSNLPPHAHPIVDVAHSHSVNQWAHSHTITTGNHSHGVNPHVHGASLMRFIGGSGQPLGVHGGVEANVNFGNTDAAGSSTDTAGNLGGFTDAPTSNVSLNASGTGLSTTQYIGSGAAMSIVPQYVALNFIIRYK